MVFIDLNKVGKECERVTAKLNDHEVAELIITLGNPDYWRNKHKFEKKKK